MTIQDRLSGKLIVLPEHAQRANSVWDQDGRFGLVGWEVRHADGSWTWYSPSNFKEVIHD